MINEDMNTDKKIELIDYNDAMQLIINEVNNVLYYSPRIIRKYTEHLMGSRGKNIRALSLVTCAINEEGLIHPDAIRFAAAIEILHLATLVHDDVMDNADLRRGDITLQKKYGKRTAVICGDYLLAASLKLAASVPEKESYLNLDIPDYVARVCSGELNQHINNNNVDLSVREYLKIISGKTAALFEASFYAGAILSEKDKNVISKYKKLGRNIGMIFQLTDDCMDFEVDRSIAKKPVQSDFEQGVITLPLIYAFKNLLSFKEKARKNRVSRKEINEVVSKTGGLNFTHMITKRYYDKSMAIICELEVRDDKKLKLKYILDKAYRII